MTIVTSQFLLNAVEFLCHNIIDSLIHPCCLCIVEINMCLIADTSLKKIHLYCLETFSNFLETFSEQIEIFQII